MFFHSSRFIFPQSNAFETYFCQIKSGRSGSDPGNVLQKQIQKKFVILSIRYKSCAFQCEGTEGGKSSQKTDKQNRKIFFQRGKFIFAHHKTESGNERTDHVYGQCTPGESGQQSIDGFHHKIPGQRSDHSGKTYQ